MERKRIEVWKDDTCGRQVGKWCVSVCDAVEGDEIECLSVHDDSAAAIQAGRLAANKRGLAVNYPAWALIERRTD